MNRTFFFSIVGLGVLSAAGIAGSRAQVASITCNGSSPIAPVVLVTQPDGNCVVARCVTLTACDPKAKGQGDCKAYTFTTQGSVSSGNAPSSTSGGGVFAVSGSGAGGVSCGPNVHALSTQGHGQNDGLAAVTVQDDGSKTSNLFQRIFEAKELEPTAIAEVEMEPVVIDLDADGAESWRADLERALVAAHGAFSVNQDETRESWQRATEEAREAQERAREAYDDAMETYRDAMQSAKERSREAHERATVERKAEAERGAQRAKRASPRSGEKVRADHEATLEERIQALEEAARGRGQAVDSKRSLEERVAQLEKLSANGLLAPHSGLFKLQGGLGATTPLPRTFRMQSPKAVAPVAPVPTTPPTPRSAPTPFNEPAPFMKLRHAAPSAPATPAPRMMIDEERQQMARAMEDLKREAARLREELARMRTEVERLPRADGTR